MLRNFATLSVRVTSSSVSLSDYLASFARGNFATFKFDVNLFVKLHAFNAESTGTGQLERPTSSRNDFKRREIIFKSLSLVYLHDESECARSKIFKRRTEVLMRQFPLFSASPLPAASFNVSPLSALFARSSSLKYFTSEK